MDLYLSSTGGDRIRVFGSNSKANGDSNCHWVRVKISQSLVRTLFVNPNRWLMLCVSIIGQLGILRLRASSSVGTGRAAEESAFEEHAAAVRCARLDAESWETESWEVDAPPVTTQFSLPELANFSAMDDN
jgi:hypothetical protein